MLEYSGPAVIELLGSSGGRHIVLTGLDCIFIVASRYLSLCDCNSRWWYLVLSLLGMCLCLAFCFLLLFLGECDGCMLPGRIFFF